MRNRVFRSRFPKKLRNVNYVDASQTARAARFPFQTFISKALIQNYTISGIGDDDEGRLFVCSLVDDILAAISGRLPATSVSHGKSFSIVFGFSAQHRRRLAPERLRLQVLFGPWDKDPQVHVSIVPHLCCSSGRCSNPPRF